MRTLINIGLALALVTGFTACTKEYAEPQFPDGIAEGSRMAAIPSSLVQGVWAVSSYQWPDGTYRNEFSGYEFVFNSIGYVVAKKGTIKVQGRWSISDTRMMMWFGRQEPLVELNSDRWIITGQTNTVVSMKSISPLNGKPEYLTLKRVR